MNRSIPEATQYQGSLNDRYDIYRANALSLGLPLKTFEKWLDN
jgi:hypothetical protein